MGKCRYCGADAGFLRSVHKDCELKYQAGLTTILSRATFAASNKTELPEFQTSVEALADAAFVPRDLMLSKLILGWQQAVRRSLEDGVVSEQEQQYLAEFAGHFDLDQGDLDGDGSWTRLVHAVVLREVLEGKIPERMQIDGNLPFVLQKSEQLVWAFPDTGYWEQRVQRSIQGRSSGVSIRVMKGVYYRVGQFKGTPVETTHMVQIDCGMLALTTKHIYFGGTEKNFRIPYSKIMSFKPYSDGLGIWRDAANAKEQVFITGDGWFVSNLARNLADQAS